MVTDAATKQADTVAKRLEAEKGIPYQVTYDRLMDAPGWREREIEYLKTQTGTSAEELEKATSYAVEGKTEAGREASRLALERSRLINKQRTQMAEAEAATEQSQQAEIEELKMKTGTTAEELNKKTEYAVEGKTEKEKEASRMALQRSYLKNKQKQQGETGGNLIVAKGTAQETVIENTPDVESLKKENPELYKILINKGVDAYNQELKNKQALERDIRIAESNRTRRLEALSDKAQKEYEQEIKSLSKTHVKVGDIWIRKDEYEQLDGKERAVLQSKGAEGLIQYQRKEYLRKYKDSISLPKDVQKIYDQSSPEDKFSLLKAYKLVPKMAEYTGSANNEPLWKVKKFAFGEFSTSREAGNILEVTAPVPFVYTLTHQEEMSKGERNFWLALDAALIVIPLAGAGIHEAATAARASQSALAVTKSARLEAALKGLKTSEGVIGGLLPGLKNETIAQLKAPVTAILHPVATTKEGLKEARNKLEALFRTDKLPFAAVSDTYGTIRVPRLAGLSAEDQMLVRDYLVKEAAQTGSNIAFEYKGYRFTLRRSLLTEELGGGLAHATPAGEAFIEGTKIKAKPGMPLSEQGLFLSPEPLPRFTESSAFGGTGELNSLLIFSPDEAKAAVSSKKIYKGMAELEAKFQVNASIEAPKQILYFRQGPENIKVYVQLQKPLSRVQIAKLKGKAIVREFTTIFNPALEIKNISGKGRGVKIVENLTEKETDDLLRILRRTGNREVAANISVAREGFRNMARLMNAEVRRGITIGNIEVNAPGREPVRIDIDAERITRANTGPVRNISLAEIRREAKEAERTPTERAATPRTPAERTPTERAATPRTPAERTPTERAATPRTPAERAPTERAATPRTPAERTPTERAATPRTPAERTPTERAATPRTPAERTPPKMPPNNAENKKNRRIIKKAKVALTWRQGQLHGKSRWDTVINPFTAGEQYIITLGARPRGATEVRGPRSAYRTAAVISGKLDRTGFTDIPGLFTLKGEPLGKKDIRVSFIKDSEISKGKKRFPLKR